MYKVIKYVNESGLSAEFVLENMIGKGQYGEVYICPVQNWDPDLIIPKVVAWKKVKLRYDDEFEEIKEREIEICSNSMGKNLIRMYSVVKYDEEVYFFFHFYNGGMLSNLIKTKKTVDEKLAARIIEQLLKGLIELHKKGYVHRDLKPDNILMHFEWLNPHNPVPHKFLKNWDYLKHSCFTTVIADLGMGRELGLAMTECAGTPLYRAPEVEKRWLWF